MKSQPSVNRMAVDLYRLPTSLLAISWLWL